MAFPPNLYAPPGGGGQQISRAAWQGPLPLVLAVCPMTGKTYPNIFVGSRYVGMAPHLLEKVGIGMSLARYATDDPFEAESYVSKLLPLSIEALKQIKDDLWDYDYLHGRKTPTW